MPHDEPFGGFVISVLGRRNGRRKGETSMPRLRSLAGSGWLLPLSPHQNRVGWTNSSGGDRGPVGDRPGDHAFVLSTFFSAP